MARNVILSIFVSATLAIAGLFSFAGGLSAHDGISRAYQSFCSSMASKNMGGISSVMASDFKTSYGDQSLDRATFLKVMSAQLGSLSKIYSVVGLVQKVTLKGSSAIAADTLRIHAQLVDPQGMLGPKGKLHEVRTTEHFRDTWVNQHGTWKLQSSVITQAPQSLLDGKPLVILHPHGK